MTREYIDTLYVDTVGGERWIRRHNSDAPRKLQREHGASVCCAEILLDGMDP